MSYCCCKKCNYLPFLLLQLWALKFAALIPCHGRALARRRALPGEKKSIIVRTSWGKKLLFLVFLLGCLVGSELLRPGGAMPAPACPCPPACAGLGLGGGCEWVFGEGRGEVLCVGLLLCLCPFLLAASLLAQGCSTRAPRLRRRSSLSHRAAGTDSAESISWECKYEV